ncbi:MAG: serine/threonine-protein kinase [Pirellula sp.]
MSEEITCQTCGTPILSTALAGICPRCLLQAAMTGIELTQSTDLQDVEEEIPNNIEDLTLPHSTPAVTKFASHAMAIEKMRYFGDYELVSEVARGGMGIVYKAKQLSLKRFVAIKMILAGELANDRDVARFYLEAEAAATLEHPNIVPIYEIGQAFGNHYYSMAFVDGESLSQRVSREVIPSREAATILCAVAEAIGHAHTKGIVHRDLKPGNILLDRIGTPLVTDFGLAKRFESTGEQIEDSQVTATGQVLGTPSYMSPEQARGTKVIGLQSDIYSLGALLYCLITGRPPFQASTHIETLLQVLNREPAMPRLLNPAIPKDLETICMKCLEKEPAARYPNCSRLICDLEHFIHGEPIQARPPGLFETSWRWVHRQREHAFFGIVAAATTILIAASTWASWTFYTRSQIGYLNLTGGRLVQTAELLDRNDRRIIPPFSIPTIESIPIPAGAYQLRVTEPGKTGQELLLDIEPGKDHEFRVSFDENNLFDPIAVPSADAYDIVDLGDGPSIIAYPYKSTSNRLTRSSGRTGKIIWTANWSEANTEDASEFNGIWKGALDETSRPALIEPTPDLDGDGVGDLVWNTSPLFAVSGKSGECIWCHRFQDDNGVNARLRSLPLSISEHPKFAFTRLLDVDNDGHLESICFGKVVGRPVDRDRLEPWELCLNSIGPKWPHDTSFTSSSDVTGIPS